jgi:hypothetical protein
MVMAMFNKVSGKYEAIKRFKSTGQEFVGVGKTKEKAKADLKSKLARIEIDYLAGLKGTNDSKEQTEKYNNIMELVRTNKLPKYAPPLEDTGNMSLHSPGFTVLQDERGKVYYGFSKDRVISVYARPDLAKFIRESRNEK